MPREGEQDIFSDLIIQEMVWSICCCRYLQMDVFSRLDYFLDLQLQLCFYTLRNSPVVSVNYNH